jgi:hypothetical protein
MSAAMRWPELVAWIAAMWFIVRPLGQRWARAAQGLTRRDKALLTEGFEALGAERVTAGLEARGHEWQDCFLALATASDGRAPSWIARIRGWDRVPGVRASVTRALAAVWDRDERGFRDLAGAWLEQRCAPRVGPDHLSRSSSDRVMSRALVSRQGASQ